GNAQVQADIRNIRTGIKTNVRFRSVESVEKVDTEEQVMNFLYQEGSIYHFMDPKTYEQFEVSATLLEDILRYLKPEAQITLMSCEGSPVSVTLPQRMSFTVTECDPAVKGMAGAMKDAKVDNDSFFKVPLFIRPGDVVVINTETGEYLEKG
ncbi:MAG: elongation factor P, partial [Deltaproteobacteria bacterium]|nr:elongation factor P [Deltaproteobacteria bacterium]